MYRLVGLKSIRHARLLISQPKVIESKTENFHSLINKQNYLLRPFGEFEMVDKIEYYCLVKIYNIQGCIFVYLYQSNDPLNFRPTDDYARKQIATSSTIPAELASFFKKKKRKKKKYTDVLQGALKLCRNFYL